MNRRNTTKHPRTHAPLLAVIEHLESRAMLAGVGPESWSAPGLAPAPLGTGVLSSSGIILTCSSPAPGSSGTASPPAPPSGSGTTSGGDLWDFFSAGSGAGGSASGSAGGVSTVGPALSSQYTGGSVVGGQGNGTVGTLSSADLWGMYWSGAGAGSSSSGSDEGSLADDPTISSQYTGGSGIGSITPLVYNPESDGPPVFHSGVFTGDQGGVQFVNAGDPDGEEGVRQTFSYEEVDDIWPIEREDYERQVEEGKWDVPEPPKPKDEFDSFPTDENGNYSWLSRQKYSDFLGQIVQTGKAFAWHMAEWLGPDEAAKIAKPLIAGGKGLAVIAFGAGKADDVDDVARAARNGKLPRWDGKKPSYTINPDHAPGTLKPGKTPLPDDAGEVFRRAVPDSDLNARHWYGQNAEGKIYRFSNSNDGTVHFSGIDGVGDGTRNITEYARRRLMEMSR